MSIQTYAAVVVLDDGEFYVELNDDDFPASDAPGFLQRRCYVGVTTPEGYECVGAFGRRRDGKWLASIDTTYDDTTDSHCFVLGPLDERLDAIVALWGARHQARCRHKCD